MYDWFKLKVQTIQSATMVALFLLLLVQAPSIINASRDNFQNNHKAAPGRIDVVVTSIDNPEERYCGANWADASRNCHVPCSSNSDCWTWNASWTCQNSTMCGATLSVPNSTIRECSPTHECLNNSTCVYELLSGDPFCNCSTATGVDGKPSLFAGKYCEYEATSYCSKSDENDDIHFCTNGGTCGSTGFCACPDGYSGDHCEYLDYLGYQHEEGTDPMQVGANEEEISPVRNSSLGVPWQSCPSELSTMQSTACVGRITEPTSGVAFCSCVTLGTPIYEGECCAYRNVSYCTSDGSYSDNLFCANGGVCRDSEEGSLIHAGCVCNSLFQGVHCEYFRAFGGGNDGPDDVSMEGPFTGTPPPSPVPSMMNPPPSEKEVLISFYYNMNGESWEKSDYWLSDINVCDWFGVACNGDQSVTMLELSSNSLQGAFDANTLRLLPNLEVLDLSYNYIYGRMDDVVGSLQNLKSLDLSNCQLRGTVPSALSFLSLEELKIQGNQLTSFLPYDGYQSLRVLDLSRNYISGTVQFDVARLANLESVDLSGNSLVGHFDKTYSLLANLTNFDVSRNRITGTLPPSGWRENSKLRFLNVSDNHLMGTIPNFLLESAFSASTYSTFSIDLSKNSFESTLPDFDVQRLHIDVAGNMLKGIDEKACKRNLWNGGDVSRFGCDEIACAVGTANERGRQSFQSGPCEKCDTSFYIGTATCQNTPTSVPSSSCRLECFNGGTCRKGYYGDREEACFCLPGYMGYQCEHIFQPTPPPSTFLDPSPPPSAFPSFAPFYCPDCSSAGLATEYCSDFYDVNRYAFCVNGGECLEVDIAPGNLHPGCSCPVGYDGNHCEIVIAEPTVYPTLAPMNRSDDFSLHQLPTFFMILGMEAADLSWSSFAEIEQITSRLLRKHFALLLPTYATDSLYITALSVTPMDPTLFSSNFTTISTDQDVIFLEVNGVVGIRDSIFNSTKAVEDFLRAALGYSFQDRDALFRQLQQSQNTQVRSVLLVELTQSVEVCPNNLRCLHGSHCANSTMEEAQFSCNCSTASKEVFPAYRGLQCEFAATQLCSDDVTVRNYSFCVNGGVCLQNNITLGEPHPGCVCSDLFGGSHCELVKEVTPSGVADTSKNSLLKSDSSGSNVIGVGGYILISAISVLLVVLTADCTI